MKSVIYGASTGHLDGWMAAGWKPEDLLLCYYGRLNRNNENKAKQELCLIPQGWPGFHAVQWFLLESWDCSSLTAPGVGGARLGHPQSSACWGHWARLSEPGSWELPCVRGLRCQPALGQGLRLSPSSPWVCLVSGDSAVSPCSVRGCG